MEVFLLFFTGVQARKGRDKHVNHKNNKSLAEGTAKNVRHKIPNFSLLPPPLKPFTTLFPATITSSQSNTIAEMAFDCGVAENPPGKHETQCTANPLT